MNILKYFFSGLLIWFISESLMAQRSADDRVAASELSQVWVADQGDGTYKNPVLHADYSDPDAIRIGDDYYLIASSFNCVPGIPVLHSKDLVNWTIIANVFTWQPPYQRFDQVQHGGGVWAPSLRFHKGEFYIFYPDPDEGIYLVKSKNIYGPWSVPVLIKKAKGWIDPCPFWDEDGKGYLINGLAGSRSGMKSTLVLSRMSSDGTTLLDDGVMVFDGHASHPTVEGPKMYKRNGYYYILAPAGGVGTGWQLALRSRSIYGPYEEKIVLEQGKSTTNGPHQGAWVDTQTGESWFLHFQDKDAYGRILHLQPLKWINDWPMMGIDVDGNGIGEPVMTYKKPNVGKTWPKATPQESDEFNHDRLGLQWQWAVNPQSNFFFPAGSSYGFLRLFNVPVPDSIKNFWTVPNLLTQKFPAPNFTATTKLTFTPRTDNEETGLIVTGIDYAYISLKKTSGGLVVSQTKCINAENGNPEQKSEMIPVSASTIYFRVTVKNIDPEAPDFAGFNTAENSKYGNGDVFMAFIPLVPTTFPISKAVQVDFKSGYTILSFFNYEGEPRNFSKRAFMNTGSGFVCEIASSDEYDSFEAFHEKISGSTIIDEYIGNVHSRWNTVRHTRYERKGLVLENEYSPCSEGIRYSTVNGKYISKPRIMVSGISE